MTMHKETPSRAPVSPSVGSGSAQHRFFASLGSIDSARHAKEAHVGRFPVQIWIANMRSAGKSLSANKMRTCLAMLGIMIGVGAVIAMLAMGAGAQARVVDRIQAMGTNLLMVRPTQRGTGGVMSGTQQNLTVQDALAITQLPGVKAVSPGVQSSVQVKYLDRNTFAAANGVSAAYFTVRNFEVQSGRMFNEREAENLGRVVVLGSITTARLFQDVSPIDQIVKIKGINFRVVGVLKSKGDQGWTGPDDELFVPYTTAMKVLFGVRYLREIDVLAANGMNLDQLSGEPPGAGGRHVRKGTLHTTPPPPNSIVALLRRRHHLLPDEADDFRIQNQAEVLEAASQTVMVFRILLGSIASISLLVGGIGIMNIMLVTVVERTREIGTRKAIGAKSHDILMQFVFEAVLLSLIGGLLGASMGIGIAKAIPLVPMFDHFRTIVEPSYVILSVSFAAIVGIVFGVYPAWRASRLDPIEALRYE